MSIIDIKNVSMIFGTPNQREAIKEKFASGMSLEDVKASSKATHCHT